MARRGEVICSRNLVEIKKVVGPSRRRFNRRLPSGHAVTITGLNKDGVLTRYRLFYFKTKHVQELTVGITIEESGDRKGPDHESESVIRSIREPGKKDVGS